MIFRSFLATMIRNHLVSLYRKDAARGGGRHDNIDDVEIVSYADAAAELDAKWLPARRQSAVEHVLTKTAMAAKTREIYKAYVLTVFPSRRSRNVSVSTRDMCIKSSPKIGNGTSKSRHDQPDWETGYWLHPC